MNFSILMTAGLLVAAPLVCADATCVPGATQLSTAFTHVAKSASPAVVFIRVESKGADGDDFDGYNDQDPFGEDLFRRFFGVPYGRRQYQPRVGQGSGFLVSQDGYIMTNAHVVKGADKIEVTLNDGEVQTATLVGADPRTDVAIIKIEKIDDKDYPFLTLGSSDSLAVGEWAIAIGSPFQLQASLTVGVVSAKGRQGLNITDLEDFIQTDAAINPGNSGGPLLNIQGVVIGMNTAIVSRTGGYMGIGFAIPSDMAKGVMNQLIQTGRVVRGFLGITPQTVDKEIAAGFNLDKVEGVLVAAVDKGSPADKAGLQPGDVILECNGKGVKSLQNFRYEISMICPGTEVALKINRKGEFITLVATLGSAQERGASTNVNQKLGIEVQPMTADMAKRLGYDPSAEGMVIVKVNPRSLAAQIGLQPGFVIQKINDRTVSSFEEYEEALSEASSGKRMLLLVRQGKISRFYSISIN